MKQQDIVFPWSILVQDVLVEESDVFVRDW